jgi:hypothetical protein
MEALRREAVGHPVLAPLYERFCGIRASSRPVSSHGDLRCSNLLFDGPLLSIIDWKHFGIRDPFQDLFSLYTYCGSSSGSRGGAGMTLPGFLELFYSGGPLAKSLLAKVTELKPSDQELGDAFYYFIAESILFKSRVFRPTWVAIAQRLGEEGFPQPWSRVITP